MKFIFADNLDQINSEYDFLSDSCPNQRQRYWDDKYPHDYFSAPPPYDGILVSRSAVGDYRNRGRYSISQSMRFRRIGARKFLRYPENKFPGSLMFGDSGAFTYVKDETPTITVDETLEFYEEGGFTHGCSTDHVIRDYHDDSEVFVPPDNIKLRYDITLENASEFLKKSSALGKNFTPLGVIQGWSPQSMANATSELLKMGYRYLAVGGLAPLQTSQIHTILSHVEEKLLGYPDATLHLLGFAKADNIAEFTKYRISSFDSTSPLLRAVKDSLRCYYLLENGQMTYYNTVRIPQVFGNRQLKRLTSCGQVDIETIIESEKEALHAIRAVAAGNMSVDKAINPIVTYNRFLLMDYDEGKQADQLAKIKQRYLETLRARPWEKCKCAICERSGVEVIIFRAGNRNKGRGFHNLFTYKKHLSSFSEDT